MKAGGGFNSWTWRGCFGVLQVSPIPAALVGLGKAATERPVQSVLGFSRLAQSGSSGVAGAWPHALD